MPGTGSLTANLLPVQFSFDRLTAWSRPVREDEDLAGLRDANHDLWHVQWDEGVVYTVPLLPDLPEPTDAERVELEVVGSLRLLARLVTDLLVRRFPTYEPLRKKPFTFLGRKNELMCDAGKTLGLDHPLLPGFRIWPKYFLDGRIIEVRPDSAFIAIAVDVATRWEIGAELEALVMAGVDLVGLYVVRRDPDADQRRLVGRVGAIRDGRVELELSRFNGQVS